MKCFWSFSTMRTHAQACILWSKYTTVWFEVDCKVTDTSNLTPSQLITFLTKKLPSDVSVIQMFVIQIPTVVTYCSISCKISNNFLFYSWVLPDNIIYFPFYPNSGDHKCSLNPPPPPIYIINILMLKAWNDMERKKKFFLL